MRQPTPNEGEKKIIEEKSRKSKSYSMENLLPLREAIHYFQSDKKQNRIKYNYDRFQNYDTNNCGHLCLKFLYTHAI
jgi:hypothetical protein